MPSKAENIQTLRVCKIIKWMQISQTYQIIIQMSKKAASSFAYHDMINFKHKNKLAEG